MKSELVWDWPIRVFHWIMVIVFSALVITGKSEGDYLELHVDLGYVLSGVLVARILYGFLGSHYGRFYQACSSIKNVFHYTSSMFNKKTVPEVGHNPLGWLMVMALILLLVLQVVSGLFSTDDIFWYGPFYDYATDEWLSIFSYVHHYLPNALIGLSVLHIGAVIVHEVCFKERLVKAMIFGKKQVLKTDALPTVKTPRVGVTISLGVSLCWLLWLFSLPS